MKLRLLFIIIFSFILKCVSAQDSLLINYLINSISNQQIKQDDYFLTGIFPSYISGNQTFSDKKKDNNIFYNELIDYTLKNVRHLLPLEQASLIDSIHNNAQKLYPKFKNKKGRNTYNFWRTDSAFSFPYTSWIKIIRGDVTLPDDLDDTVLSLWATNAPDSVAAQIHQLMQSYINDGEKKFRNATKDFKKYPAYSTWFGKNFPIVFDACVLSNVLSFVQSYNLQWIKADSASLNVLVDMVQHQYHITQPLKVAPYYGNTSIILYHLARLMCIKYIPELEALKPQLIADAVTQFANTNNVLEKAILCSAIYKWGYVAPTFILPSQQEIQTVIEQNDLPFFIGNISSYLSPFIKQIVFKNDSGLYYHYCPAYNDALFLEYLLLKQQATRE